MTTGHDRTIIDSSFPSSISVFPSAYAWPSSALPSCPCPSSPYRPYPYLLVRKRPAPERRAPTSIIDRSIRDPSALPLTIPNMRIHCHQPAPPGRPWRIDIYPARPLTLKRKLLRFRVRPTHQPHNTPHHTQMLRRDICYFPEVVAEVV